MKKVLTDPRVLTGQKGAMSLTQWYDSELTDDVVPPVAPSDDQLNVTGTSEQCSASATLNDTTDGLLHRSRLNGVGESVSSHEQERLLRERLKEKINRTNNQLQSQQDAQQQSVNEYLRLAQSIPAADHAQAQRIKAAFERRNQKSATVVASLQKKLDSYKQRMRVLEQSGSVSSAASSNTSTGASPWQAMDLLRGLRSISAKPKAFAHLMRKQFGSADNIADIKAMNDDESSLDIRADSCGRNTLPSNLSANFHCHSDEDLSKVLSTPARAPTITVTAATSTVLKCAAGPTGLLDGSHVIDAQPPDFSDDMFDKHGDLNGSQESISTALYDSLQQATDAMKEQKKEIIVLKEDMMNKMAHWKEMFEIQKTRTDFMVEKVNSMTDLHQGDFYALKQDLSILEDKLEYQLHERMRDMQEMVDNCHNRLARLEAAQQPSTVDSIPHTEVRASMVKLINVALSFAALLLIIVGFVVNMFGPFFNTRSRRISTAVFVVIAAVVWYHWDLIVSHCQLIAVTVAHKSN